MLLLFKEVIKQGSMLSKTEDLTSKKNDIFEFIRVALLRPEQIDVILPHIIQSSMSSHKSNLTAGEVQEKVKNHILSDQYLEQFVPTIEQIFSHEEINKLIQFYKDPSVEKYFKNGVTLGPAIYSSFGKAVQSILLATKS